jgi:uncharacterized protein YndB with AHSA1/START domain
MARLHAEAERIARADPGTVWALVSEAARYPEWGPWISCEYQRPGDTSPRGPGAVYRLRSSRRYLGRHPVQVERVLEAEQGRFLAYTLLKGIPIRNYRAEVTLTPADGGTCIRWTGEWDATLMGRLIYRDLSKVYPQVVTALAAAAEKQAGTGSEPRSDSGGQAQ